MTNPDFLNTKITSVFKTINVDTLEQMTQIRTDEFGLQSVKLRELENEIAKSKMINSELLVNNYIMKSKLEKQNESFNTPVLLPKQHVKNKTGQLEEKLNRYATKKINLEDSLHASFEEDLKTESSGTSNHKNISSTSLTSSENQNQADSKCYSKIYTFTGGRTSVEDISRNKLKIDFKTSNVENKFCWRCMRRGHLGNTCKETSTVLGRNICEKCNMVGHHKEQCCLR